MIVFFDKRSGEITSVIPETSRVPPDFSATVEVDGKKVRGKKDVDYVWIKPSVARDFLDPRKPERDIGKCRMKNNKLYDHKGKRVRFVHKNKIKSAISDMVKQEKIKL